MTDQKNNDKHAGRGFAAKAKAGPSTCSASLRWDERGGTFLVRALGTDIASGGRYAMKTHVGVDLHQRFCYVTAVSASGKRLKHGQCPTRVLHCGPGCRVWRVRGR